MVKREAVLKSKAYKVEIDKLSSGQFNVTIGEKKYSVDAKQISKSSWSIVHNGRQMLWSVGGVDGDVEALEVHGGNSIYNIMMLDPKNKSSKKKISILESSKNIVSPMPGRVVKILIAENASVEEGAGVIVVEAMKMQNELRATKAGIVKKIHVKEGDGVESRTLLVEIE